MSSNWKEIKITNKPTGTPPLLVKYLFGASTYRVYLTDLVSLWTESLEQTDIIQRAKSTASAIDAGDHDQCKILLRHIQGCLDEQPDTRVYLSHSSRNLLELHLHDPLSNGLKALKWPVHLNLRPQHVFTDEFVLPFLSQQLGTNIHISSLLQTIDEKDHVIERLTDKMESEGIELSKVFPGIALSKSRPGVNRESLGKLVKGLGAFSQTQQQFHLSEDTSDQPVDLEDLISKVCKGRSTYSIRSIQVLDPRWWKHLERQDPERGNKLASSFPHSAISQNSTNEGFQTQSPPFHLKASLLKPEVPTLGSSDHLDTPKTRDLEDSTTEDSDDELDSVQRKADHSQPGLPVFIEKPDSTSFEQHRAGTTSPSTVSPALTPPSNSTPPKKVTLGKIGGTKSAANTANIEPPSNFAESLRQSPKLDRIDDNRSHHIEPGPSSPELAKSEGHSLEARSASIPRVSSQERADRKREELKRDLELKSNQAAKKKRKF